MSPTQRGAADMHAPALALSNSLRARPSDASGTAYGPGLPRAEREGEILTVSRMILAQDSDDDVEVTCFGAKSAEEKGARPLTPAPRPTFLLPLPEVSFPQVIFPPVPTSHLATHLHIPSYEHTNLAICALARHPTPRPSL